MIIGLESVLRSIPTALSRRQALFVEGIRFSIEMADLAYYRLRETLIRLAKFAPDDPQSPGTVSAMLDAWSIVDALHRLRGLVRHMPGIEKRDRIPPIRAFFDSTKSVPALRNTVQHLDTDIAEAVDDRNWAVLGSLSWGVIDPEQHEVTACVFMPGMPLGSRPIVNPLNRQVWHLPVDSITIERGGVLMPLSDAMRRVAALAAGLERMLAEAYAKQIPTPGRHAADLTIVLRMSIRPDQIVPDGTPEPEPAPPPQGSEPVEDAQV
jgi:hypothetical protein